MIEVIKTGVVFLFGFAPYVFMLWFVCDMIRDIRRKEKLEKEEEKACKERNRAIYVLALELKRLNDRLECTACPGTKSKPVKSTRRKKGITGMKRKRR